MNNRDKASDYIWNEETHSVSDDSMEGNERVNITSRQKCHDRYVLKTMNQNQFKNERSCNVQLGHELKSNKRTYKNQKKSNTKSDDKYETPQNDNSTDSDSSVDDHEKPSKFAKKSESELNLKFANHLCEKCPAINYKNIFGTSTKSENILQSYQLFGMKEKHTDTYQKQNDSKPQSNSDLKSASAIKHSLLRTVQPIDSVDTHEMPFKLGENSSKLQMSSDKMRHKNLRFSTDVMHHKKSDEKFWKPSRENKSHLNVKSHKQLHNEQAIKSVKSHAFRTGTEIMGKKDLCEKIRRNSHDIKTNISAMNHSLLHTIQPTESVKSPQCETDITCKSISKHYSDIRHDKQIRNNNINKKTDQGLNKVQPKSKGVCKKRKKSYTYASSTTFSTDSSYRLYRAKCVYDVQKYIDRTHAKNKIASMQKDDLFTVESYSCHKTKFNETTTQIPWKDQFDKSVARNKKTRRSKIEENFNSSSSSSIITEKYNKETLPKCGIDLKGYVELCKSHQQTDIPNINNNEQTRKHHSDTYPRFNKQIYINTQKIKQNIKPNVIVGTYTGLHDNCPKNSSINDVLYKSVVRHIETKQKKITYLNYKNYYDNKNYDKNKKHKQVCKKRPRCNKIESNSCSSSSNLSFRLYRDKCLNDIQEKIKKTRTKNWIESINIDNLSPIEFDSCDNTEFNATTEQIPSKDHFDKSVARNEEICMNKTDKEIKTTNKNAGFSKSLSIYKRSAKSSSSSSSEASSETTSSQFSYFTPCNCQKTCFDEHTQECKDAKDRFKALKEIEQDAINTKLNSLGLKSYRVPGDGNCLFAALRHQLYLHKNYHVSVKRLRQLTANYLREHKLEVMPFMYDETNHCQYTDLHFQFYCNKLETTTLWGGQVELQAISKIFQCPIKIIQARAQPTIHGENFTGPLLTVTYSENRYKQGPHYDSTVPNM